jgi:hypothetical protein
VFGQEVYALPLKGPQIGFRPDFFLYLDLLRLAGTPNPPLRLLLFFLAPLDVLFRSGPILRGFDLYYDL